MDSTGFLPEDDLGNVPRARNDQQRAVLPGKSLSAGCLGGHLKDFANSCLKTKLTPTRIKFMVVKLPAAIGVRPDDCVGSFPLIVCLCPTVVR